MEKLNRRAILFMIFAAFLLPLSACGKKGPPVPPSSSGPPAIVGPEITRDENLMTLTWRVAAHEDELETVPGGFYVYRARIALSGGCLDCPWQFERAAEVPVENAQIRTTYTELLEKGFRYGYKVSAYTDGGNEGEASVIVAVDFPDGGKTGE
jgi:predicted small lipoprotein YifL